MTFWLKDCKALPNISTLLMNRACYQNHLGKKKNTRKLSRRTLNSLNRVVSSAPPNTSSHCSVLLQRFIKGAQHITHLSLCFVWGRVKLLGFNNIIILKKKKRKTPVLHTTHVTSGCNITKKPWLCLNANADPIVYQHYSDILPERTHLLTTKHIFEFLFHLLFYFRFFGLQQTEL